MQRSHYLGSLTLLASVLLRSIPGIASAPVPSDSRYEITLFAEAPDIVTPIGASADSQGRLFVVESHTMDPPENYAGPTNDLIKVFFDRNHDGHADGFQVFSSSLKQAVRVLLLPDGSVLVCCAREIVRLRDTDGDGRADQREQLLRLECDDPFLTGLWAMTLGPDGRLYVVRILTPFPHRTTGSDGSFVAGYADGGSVLRCNPNGSHLEEVATGFWAPPALHFDRAGRLLMVDNDPLAKGPNRLIHCLENGDYGYRARYGLGGDSPLVALSGELPGTLPGFGALGEAPSDFWICSESPFPAGYENSLLVTSWGANLIERHEVSDSSGALKTTRSPWMVGGADFKPSGLTVDARGNLYVSDWVRNDFQNHGHGKIWRIAPKQDVALASPLPRAAHRWEPKAPRETSDRTAQDPVARHVATLALSHHISQARKLLNSDNPGLRVEAMMALRRGLTDSADIDRVIKQGLADTDPEVRITAVLWTADQQRTSLKRDLTHLLEQPGLSPRLVETTLAAIAALDKEFVDALRGQVPFPDEKLPSSLPDSLTHPLLRNARLARMAAAKALPWLEDPKRPETKSLLQELARTRSAPLNLAALEVLKDNASERDTEWFLALATETERDPNVRATALNTCAAWLDTAALMEFLHDPQEAVQLEAVLALKRPLNESTAPRTKILQSLTAIRSSAGPRVKAEILSILTPEIEPHPSTLSDWQTVLASGGDASAGRRRFFAADAQCSRCHSIEGRGGKIGPDLGSLAWTQDRSTIIRSILRPSEFFGPEYQVREVETKSGTTYAGALWGIEPDGSMTLLLPTGEMQKVPGEQIAHWRALPASLMPDGLEAAWSVESLRDVVAFLSEHRAR